MTKIVRTSVLVAATVLTAFVVYGAKRGTDPVIAMTEEELTTSFESAIGNLALHWDSADPRSEEERMRALYTFIYETFDASAWIPQSLFDVNAITQIVVGEADSIIRENVGLVLWDDNPLVAAFGMERRFRRAPVVDGELPGLPHGRDRRRRLLRGRDEDLRRPVARRSTEEDDE